MLLENVMPEHTEFLANSPNVRFLNAARYGTVDRIRNALDMGANPLAYNKYEDVTNDALLRAASHQDPAVIYFLIELGLDRIDRSHLDQTLLTTLARRQWTGPLATIINRGTPVDTADQHGTTALMAAAATGRLESIEVLLGLGASVTARDQFGNTALHRAGNGNVVKMLLGAGANIDTVNDTKRTPLSHQVRYGSVSVAAALLASGADIEAKDIDGNTPLHVGAEAGMLEAIMPLLDAGADIEALDNYGNTPLIKAACEKKSTCVEALIARGAEVNTKNDEGYSALLYAATYQDVESLLALLDAGADRLVRDSDGQGISDLLDKKPEARAAYDAWCARSAIRIALGAAARRPTYQ